MSISKEQISAARTMRAEGRPWRYIANDLGYSEVYLRERVRRTPTLRDYTVGLTLQESRK